MGWGCHPDTLCLARARGVASRSGHAEGTADYVQAFRDAYVSGARPGSRGLDTMTANLDARIAELRSAERGEAPSPPADHVADTFADVGVKVYRP